MSDRIEEAVAAMSQFSEVQLGLHPDHTEVAAMPAAEVDAILSLTMGDFRALRRAELTLHQLIHERKYIIPVLEAASDYARLTMVERFPVSDIAVQAAYERLRAAIGNSPQIAAGRK